MSGNENEGLEAENITHENNTLVAGDNGKDDSAGEIEPDEKKAKTTLTNTVEGAQYMEEENATKKENVGNEAEESALEILDDFITVKVAYSKKIYDTKISKSHTVKDLKIALKNLTGVPESLQKLMYKGKLNDGDKIKDTSLSDGCKVLLVGSKESDVVQVNQVPTKRELLDDNLETKSSEPLCQQTQHKKVLEKGKPENVMVGIKNTKEPLPLAPLTGMIKQDGGHVRLTFKLESDELWIGTKERTHKLPMNSIKSIHNEPITDQEEYSIVGIQTGTTLKSTIWVYWVPTQYVDAIKDTILGKFLF